MGLLERAGARLYANAGHPTARGGMPAAIRVQPEVRHLRSPRRYQAERWLRRLLTKRQLLK